jgi:DNA-binding HxlR family transcriptional regulator
MEPLPPCPVVWFNDLLGGRHKLRVVWELRRGARRYSEVRRALVSATGGRSITPRVLSRELKELEAAGLIHRKAYPEVPPRVEYSLTAAGKALVPVLNGICRWASKANDAYA